MPTKDLTPSELGNSTFLSPLTYFKSISGSYVLAYEILVKAPDAHWWYTNASDGTLLEKSDLMISCNFDVPVETDAMPFTQREHKNHSHS
jgi:hypothetical protein